jgi:hypothetical protein
MTNRPDPNRRRLIAATLVALATLTALIGAAPAHAEPKHKPPSLTIDGAGTWQIREWINDVVVNGTGQLVERNGRSTHVTVAAVVDPDDGSLPAAGECESAFATLSAYDAPGIDLTLVGGGQICGSWAQPPTSTVIYVFTGRYEVYGDGTMPKRLLGTDGFYEVRLADNGTASAFAIDT